MKKLLTTTVLGFAMVLGSASLALAATSGTAVPGDTTLPGYPGSTAYTAPLTSGDANDNNIGNANQTGKNVTNGTDTTGTNAHDVIKSDGMNNKFEKDGSQTTGTVTQRTHGEYQNNTNSCASCHQTHTGAGDALIFKDTVYDTCTACHDGTLGFYNVFSPSTAGTFGGTTAGNASVHMAKGTLTTSAAPGGNQSGTDPASWGKTFNCASCHSPHGSYSDRLLNFNPNDVARTPMSEGGELVTGAISKVDPLAADKAAITASLPAQVNGIPTKYIVAEMTAGQADLLQTYPNTTAKIVGSKLADGNGTTGATMASGDNVLVVLAWKDMTTATGHPASEWVRDTNAWVNGHEYNETFHNKMDFVYVIQDAYRAADGAASTTDTLSGGKLIDGAYYLDPETVDSTDVTYVYGAKDKNKVLLRSTETTGFTYSYNGAFAKLSAATDFTGYNAYIARARVTKLSSAAVPMSVKEYFGGDPTTGAGGLQITMVNPAIYESASKGVGVAISNFCAACHTDYFTKSSNPVSADGEGPTGIWTKAFRHTTNSDNYTCLKCHFAHGTDVTVMMDAQDRTVDTAATALFAGNTAQATDYMLDKNPTSALKRYTNQAICWKCHTSSHSTNLMNNDYVYNVNTDAATNNNITSGYSAPSNDILPYAAPAQSGYNSTTKTWSGVENPITIKP